eukprot:UN02900
MEITEGRGKMYNFHFIGTVETYEDVLDLDISEFREKILDLFDIPYDKDLKELRVEKDDEGQEEYQYKITCGFNLKTKMDPFKYINETFEEIVEEEYFQGAVQRGFDLNIAPELIRWEGKFKRMHQRDHRIKRKKKDMHSKGLSKDDLEEDQERREMIRQKKEKEAQKKVQRDQEKADKHSELVSKYADNAYQYDVDNPNYKKSNEEKDSDY